MSHLDCITELNSIDIEVYNAARKTFQELIESRDYDAAKLKRFKSLNQHVSPLLNAVTPATRWMKRRFI